MITRISIKPYQKNRVKGLLADWSGTLVDRYCLVPEKAMLASYKKNSVPMTSDRIRKYMGLPKRAHIAANLAEQDIITAFHCIHDRCPNDADVEKIYFDFNRFLDRKIATTLSDPIPYAVPVIRHIRNSGIKVGVTTGFTMDVSTKISTYAAEKGLYIDACVGSDSVVNGSRPLPFMGWKCLDVLGIPDINTSVIVKIGDSDLDIKEGINIGCWTVGVYGYSTHMNVEKLPTSYIELQKNRDDAKYKLEAAGADYVIEDLRRLPDVINHINQRLNKV